MEYEVDVDKIFQKQKELSEKRLSQHVSIELLLKKIS